MDWLLNTCTAVFASFDSFWQRESDPKEVLAGLVFFFSLTAIARNRQSLSAPPLAAKRPVSHVLAFFPIGLSPTRPVYLAPIIGLCSVLLPLTFHRFYTFKSQGPEYV